MRKKLDELIFFFHTAFELVKLHQVSFVKTGTKHNCKN